LRRPATRKTKLFDLVRLEIRSGFFESAIIDSFFLGGYLDPLAFDVEANPREKAHVYVGNPNKRKAGN